jgi:hypothetical protein
LILAWKFLQDKTYTNSAWSRICGLPVSEINENEKCVLAALGWGLDVDSSVFSGWSKGLEKLAKLRVERNTGSPITNTSQKRNLDEIANLVDSAMHYEASIMQQEKIRQMLVHSGLYSNGILGTHPTEVAWSGLPSGVKAKSHSPSPLLAASPASSKLSPSITSLGRRHKRRNSSALKLIAELHQDSSPPTAGGPIRRKRSMSVGSRAKR